MRHGQYRTPPTMCTNGLMLGWFTVGLHVCVLYTAGSVVLGGGNDRCTHKGRMTPVTHNTLTPYVTRACGTQ